MTEKILQTYDYVCFSELAYEFDISDTIKIEKKIRRRLTYYNLGIFDRARIDYIRQLKKEIYDEISLQIKSKYYTKSESRFADLSDFDNERMTSDFLVKYQQIEKPDMTRILNLAIYLYYMR